MKHKVCQYCGANLDWGERCDCQFGEREEKEDRKEWQQKKEARKELAACRISA